MKEYEISEGNILEMQNLISFRGILTQNDVLEIVKEINNIVDNSNSQKNGQFVTVIYSNDLSNNVATTDIEILLPLTKKIVPPSGYSFKPKFKLNNALKLHYKGNPLYVKQAVQELNNYIKKNNLVPITAMYNVTVFEPKTADELDEYTVDIYIGISNNIL